MTHYRTGKYLHLTSWADGYIGYLTMIADCITWTCHSCLQIADLLLTRTSLTTTIVLKKRFLLQPTSSLPLAVHSLVRHAHVHIRLLKCLSCRPRYCKPTGKISNWPNKRHIWSPRSQLPSPFDCSSALLSIELGTFSCSGGRSPHSTSVVSPPICNRFFKSCQNETFVS